MSDGTPQVQPVWCSYDGSHVLINTEKGRQKYRNLSKRRTATVLVIDPNDDNRWLEIRGTVASETEDGAEEHIDALAKVYMGLDRYPYPKSAPRVIVRIAPQRVVTLAISMPETASTP
jgi:PPOX class probable F420-dependent enzyme